MEQLVILIIIAAISLINWLLQKSAEHKEARRDRGNTPMESSRESGVELDRPGSARQLEGDGSAQEEQMRRFFEALGLPLREEAPPTPVINPTFEAEPPALPVPVPAPRAVHREKPRVLPGPTVVAEPAKPTLREAREMRELAERFAAHEVDAASSTGTQAVFRNLLSNPHAARQAIILQEVLNPPRALRPYSA